MSKMSQEGNISSAHSSSAHHCGLYLISTLRFAVWLCLQLHFSPAHLQNEPEPKPSGRMWFGHAVATIPSSSGQHHSAVCSESLQIMPDPPAHMAVTPGNSGGAQSPAPSSPLTLPSLATQPQTTGTWDETCPAESSHFPKRHFSLLFLCD